MELELKHLAPYLPYKLNILDVITNKRKVMNLGQGASTNWVGIKTVLNYYESDNFIYRPILKPLPEKDFTSRDYTWNEWEFFLKNHYDIFGLIEKGFAININISN
ncbi:MAG: hypothetical protein ACM31G_07175 [Flavobacteriales bacterium]